MKRSTPLTRRTPLEPKTALRRTTALARRPLARSVLHAESAERRQLPKRRTAKPIPAVVRKALAVRSGGWCEIAALGCTGLAVDPSHRKKTGAGGRHGDATRRHHVLSNLLHACRWCHDQHVHARPATAYERGWMLREHQDPTREPVLYRGAWHLLGDDGSTSPATHARGGAMATTEPNYVQQVVRELADRLPDCDTDLIDLYALLVLIRGTDTTLKDVHDTWAVWRNATRPGHQSLIPFDQLTAEVQELDRKYQLAIHEAAKAVA